MEQARANVGNTANTVTNSVIKNSRGSSAGSGSGDCQTYIMARRHEMCRIEQMRRKIEDEKKDANWREQLEARQRVLDEKRAKKGLIRKRKKARAKELAQMKKKSSAEASASCIQCQADSSCLASINGTVNL